MNDLQATLHEHHRVLQNMLTNLGLVPLFLGGTHNDIWPEDLHELLLEIAKDPQVMDLVISRRLQYGQDLAPGWLERHLALIHERAVKHFSPPDEADGGW